MPFVKGQPNPGKGRPKGQPNKLTATLKDMILQALANAGGTSYLEAQAKANPTAFLTLVGRILPLQVKDGGSDPRVPTTVIHEYYDKPPQI